MVNGLPRDEADPCESHSSRFTFELAAYQPCAAPVLITKAPREQRPLEPQMRARFPSAGLKCPLSEETRSVHLPPLACRLLDGDSSGADGLPLLSSTSVLGLLALPALRCERACAKGPPLQVAPVPCSSKLTYQGEDSQCARHPHLRADDGRRLVPFCRLVLAAIGEPLMDPDGWVQHASASWSRTNRCEQTRTAPNWRPRPRLLTSAKSARPRPTRPALAAAVEGTRTQRPPANDRRPTATTPACADGTASRRQPYDHEDGPSGPR